MDVINAESITKIVDALKAPDRKGFIILPSINGFDLFEIPEDRLKSYLAIESMHNNLNKKKIESNN